MAIIRAGDYSVDARARKQAATLANAGARVILMGVGSDVPRDAGIVGHDVRLWAPARLREPRLGKESVWWPVRVAVNLTYGKYLARRFRNRWSPICGNESLMVAAAIEAGIDVVHAYNAQALPIAMRIKECLGARVVYDVRDLQADVDYHSQAVQDKLSRIESGSIHSADAVITVSDPLAEVLEHRHGPARPIVIWNGPAVVANEAVAVHKPVRILFQGAFTRNRYLAGLVKAMTLLRGRATLDLQGFGSLERDLRTQVDLLGLNETVRFLPATQPLCVVPDAVDHDVGVICYQGSTLNLQVAVPNKLMDYLGAGLAVAASDLPGHRSVLDGTGAGVFIDPATPETIADGLSQLIDNPERISSMKRAALELAKKYEWSVQAEKLVEVYESILIPSGSPPPVKIERAARRVGLRISSR